MKMVKSLALSAAVSLAAFASAQASCTPNGSAANYCPVVMTYDSGTLLMPVKGDKTAYIPMSPIVAYLPIKGDIGAEGNGGISREGLNINTVTATGPACFLKPEFVMAEGAGLGIYKKNLFHSTADNTG